MKRYILAAAAASLIAFAPTAFADSFSAGGAHGSAFTGSAGGSLSASGSLVSGNGAAGGFTNGYSTTAGGAQAVGNGSGVTVQDFRNSTSGANNAGWALGDAGTLNGSLAGAAGIEGASASFGNFGTKGGE